MRWEGRDLLIHEGSGVRFVEEMPVAEDGVADLFCGLLIYGVDGEGAAGRGVADVEEGVFDEAFGMVVCEAGEECGSPL